MCTDYNIYYINIVTKILKSLVPRDVTKYKYFKSKIKITLIFTTVVLPVTTVCCFKWILFKRMTHVLSPFYTRTWTKYVYEVRVEFAQFWFYSKYTYYKMTQSFFHYSHYNVHHNRLELVNISFNFSKF
jgi:hypothetical protein